MNVSKLACSAAALICCARISARRPSSASISIASLHSIFHLDAAHAAPPILERNHDPALVASFNRRGYLLHGCGYTAPNSARVAF